MARMLKNTFRGDHKERMPHDWLNTIANFWNGLSVENGTLQKSPDGRHTTIICYGTSSEGTTAVGTIAPLLTLGTNTEGSSTADTGTWTRGDLSGTTQDLLACKTWFTSRPFYDPAGDHKLYAFMRPVIVDTLGAVQHIGAETKVEIEDPISHGSL
jgi:hypothetical protein